MSKLEELINKLCPNGVEYKSFGDVVRFINGRAYKQEELLQSGKYKVLRVGNFFTSDSWYYSDLELENEKYCNKGDLLYAWAASLGPKIWNGDKTIFHYHIWKLEFDEKVLSKKYLYHFLRFDVDKMYESLTHSTMPHVSMGSMQKREIPVPPLEIQNEIVRILDNFTELEEELEEELVARRKQYEYYRDSLLSFDDSVEWKKLGDIATRIKGTPITATQMKLIAADNGEIKIFAGGKTVVNAHESDIPNANITKVPAVLVQSRGTIDFVYYDKPFTFKNEMWAYTFENQITVKYIYYVLKNNVEHFRKITESMGAFPQIALPDTEKYKVPLPDIKAQEKIVNILDRFEALCNDITSGLPAEIEARHKQYEYYRDKLLTFKRKSA